MPCPSIAYINTDHTFDSFGDITLVCSPEMSNPAQKDLLSCDADIYSPRFPALGYDVDRNKLKSLLMRGQQISDHFSDSSNLVSKIEDFLESNPVSELSYSLNSCPELLLMFKEDVLGEKFNPEDWPEEKTKFRSVASESENIQVWVNQYFKISNNRYFDKNDPAINELTDLVSSYIKEKALEVSVKIKTNSSEAPRKARDFEYFLKQFEKDLFFENTEGEKSLSLHALVEIENDYKKWSRDKTPLDKNVLRSSTFNIDERTRIQFDSWLEDTFSDAIKKAYFRHSTPSGNVIKKKLDLDSITRIMKKNLRGGENYNYGAGNIRSKVAKSFKNWRSLESESYRLIEEDDFQAIKDKTNDKLLELIEDLRPFYRFEQNNLFIQTDDIVDIISEYAGGRFQALSEGFKTDGEFPRDKIDKFLDDMRHMETQYFEGKFKRAVHLSEFSAALVPEAIKENAKDIIDILEREGLRVLTYNPDIENDRKEKLIELASNNELLRVVHDSHGLGMTK